MDVERLDDLRELIGEYWHLAFAEGQEGRSTDTPDGAAQKCISAIEAIIREARAALTPPEGYVLIPVIPAYQMVKALAETAGCNLAHAALAYRDALAARPEVKL